MSAGRVLVVDDEEDYRVMMVSHLRRKGYEVEAAGSGEEALEQMRSEGSIEVLITDLMMPNMGGLELLKQAKQEDPYLEVVVISGAGTLESAISSMRAGGAYDYLPKPLDTVDDLSLAVGRAAEHRSLRLEQERLQAQIAAERERLQWVIENTGDALISSENGRTISLTNPAAQELFSGEDLADQDAVESLPAPVASVLQSWKQFELRRPMVTEVAWPEGRIQMLSLTLSDDGAAGWVMLLREVTELRELQRLKMRLMAQTAEEVREPLTGALSNLVELNELPDPETVPEQYTSAVQQGMNNLGAIRSWTEQVLDLVEMEARAESEGERVPLIDVVETLLASELPDLLRDKDISVELEVAASESLAVQSAVARKLVEHLLLQAGWRAPSGDSRQLSLVREGRQLQLALRDHGAPLLRGAGVELFEAYLALETDPPPGVGLSLAMVKSAADALGAHLWLQCSHTQSDGDGNTFLVTFPVSGEGAA